MVDYKGACKEIIEKLYEKYVQPSNLFAVYNIFIEHFGEDFVDLQNYISLQEFKKFLSSCCGNDFGLESKYQYTLLRELPANKCYYTLENLFQKAGNDKIEDFIDYFIEEQGYPEIIVHYPEVTVTNEHNRSIVITDLYTKIIVNYNGTLCSGSVYMTRGSYTVNQLRGDYMHSHANGIPLQNQWNRCCLGEGPINSTIANLICNFDSDIWYLLCFELSKYVTVESLTGIPYKYLENVLGESVNNCNDSLLGINTDLTYNTSNLGIPDENFKSIIHNFIKYLIHHNNIKYVYNENKFNLGIPDIDFIIYISNLFISWYNNAYNSNTYYTPYNYFIGNKYLLECKIINNTIYRISRYGSNNENLVTRYIDRPICKFKNQDIKLKIINYSNYDNETTNNNTILLNINVVSYIATKLLYIINYRYGTVNNNDAIEKRTRFF